MSTPSSKSDSQSPTQARGLPIVFDRARWRQRRARAAHSFGQADFLKRLAAEVVVDRLHDITRTFPLTLDLGCHTGAVAASLQGTDKVGTLVQTDGALPMVRQAGGLRVAADEEALPFADHSFDAAVSALTLHTVNDLPGTLVQIRRALKPDGVFVGALLGGTTLHELRTALSEAELEIRGGISPRVAPMLAVKEGGALLQRAGFALPVADSDARTVTYAHPLHLLRDLRAMGETSVLAAGPRTPLPRAVLARALEIYRERFGIADGRVVATFEIVTLTGWSPHESQPQPKRPGSATARLADALGAEEVNVRSSLSGGSVRDLS